MMVRAIVGIGALFFFWSCTNFTKETVSSTRIGYENTNFTIASTPGCQGDSACALFEISYPVFHGIDTAVAAKIQREIELSFSMGDPEASEKSIQQVANEFIASYREFSREMPDAGMGWYYKGNARVNVLVDTLISISIDEDYFTGGAHGGTGKYFINVNPKSGNKVALREIFKQGYESALAQAGEELFRKERELADTSTYQFNNFEFPDNKFKLNDNYGVTTEGLIFYFNNYEIAPYAAGPTEIFIPFEKLKGWLKNSPALQ